MAAMLLPRVKKVRKINKILTRQYDVTTTSHQTINYIHKEKGQKNCNFSDLFPDTKIG
jgi:hypothetical protein